MENFSPITPIKKRGTGLWEPHFENWYMRCSLSHGSNKQVPCMSFTHLFYIWKEIKWATSYENPIWRPPLGKLTDKTKKEIKMRKKMFISSEYSKYCQQYVSNLWQELLPNTMNLNPCGKNKKPSKLLGNFLSWKYAVFREVTNANSDNSH